MSSGMLEETVLTQMEKFLKQVEENRVRKFQVERIIENLQELEEDSDRLSRPYIRETKQYFESVKTSLEVDPSRGIDTGKAKDIVLEYEHRIQN